MKKRKTKNYAEIPYTSLHRVYKFIWWCEKTLEEDLEELLEDVPYGIATEILEKADNKVRRIYHAYDALYSSPITQRKQKLEEAFTRAGYFDEEDEEC